VAVNCLVVDDNNHFLRAARDLLEREGLVVVGVASTSAEALRRADELQPDVMLVDIDLGEESGFDLAQELVAACGVKRSSVILMSVYSETDFADMIAASAAVAFLRKSDLSGRAIREILGGTGEQRG
jgi:CheY-like chemotaxis protein